MNTNLTADHLYTQIAFKYGDAVAKELMQQAQNVADGTSCSQLFSLDEIRLALSKVKVKGHRKEAEEFVDFMVACGEQRGEMLMEFTKKAAYEAGRDLLRALDVEVPCDCKSATCEGEMQPGCGHLDAVQQLELEAMTEQRHG